MSSHVIKGFRVAIRNKDRQIEQATSKAKESSEDSDIEDGGPSILDMMMGRPKVPTSMIKGWRIAFEAQLLKFMKLDLSANIGTREAHFYCLCRVVFTG